MTVDLDEAIARLEIQDVLWRYARGIDRADYDLLRTVYHPEAIDHHTKFTGPGWEYAKGFVDSHGHAPTVGTHYITNMLITMDDRDNARVESYFLAFHPHGEEEGAERMGIAAGRYLDHFQRREDGWKILVRQVVMDWTRDDVPSGPWADVDRRPIPGQTKLNGDASVAFFA